MRVDYGYQDAAGPKEAPGGSWRVTCTCLQRCLALSIAPSALNPLRSAAQHLLSPCSFMQGDGRYRGQGGGGKGRVDRGQLAGKSGTAQFHPCMIVCSSGVVFEAPAWVLHSWLLLSSLARSACGEATDFHLSAWHSLPFVFMIADDRLDAPLPWDHIDTGIAKWWLKTDLQVRYVCRPVPAEELQRWVVSVYDTPASQSCG